MSSLSWNGHRAAVLQPLFRNAVATALIDN